MNELTVWLSDEEVGIIGNELNKLFLFQDRPFSKDKQAAFLEEIRGWGLPAGAIISGIRKLKSEDLKSLKLTTIREASHDFIAYSEETEKCDACISGVIIMHDEEKRQFALSCNCPRGRMVRNNSNLTGWNGANTQFSNKRVLLAS